MISDIGHNVELLLQLAYLLVVALTQLYLLARDLEIDLLNDEHLGGKLVSLTLKTLDLTHVEVSLFLQLSKDVFFIVEHATKHTI